MPGLNYDSVKAFNEPLTPEAKYWLGFLLADGCVSRTTLSCGLKEIDLNHLIKLRSFLKAEDRVPICYVPKSGYGKFPNFKLMIASRLLTERLKEFGIVPRKSLVAKPVKGLENDIDFWRGMLDGDGAIYVGHPFGSKPLFNLGLYGAWEVVTGFVKFCEPIIDKTLLITPAKNIHVAKTSGKFAKKIAKLLYYKNCLALDRKLKIVQENIDE